MTDEIPRENDRASMLLATYVRLDDAVQKAVIRNLSASGIMVEMEGPPGLGTVVGVLLGSLGWVDATVMWRIGTRFGAKFFAPIDPVQARKPVSGDLRPYEPPPPPPRRIL